MEEIKSTIQGRELVVTGDKSGLPSDHNSTVAETTLEDHQGSIIRPLLNTSNSGVIKKSLARNASVSSLKATSPASSSISVLPNSLHLSVNASMSSESLGRNSSMSRNSSSLHRSSQSEIDSSDFGSGTRIGSTDETNTVSSRTDQMGLASSCVSLGDLSMGSDSVFVSETETISDVASRKGVYPCSRSHPTESEIEFMRMGPFSPSNKHVHFQFDSNGKQTDDNFAQSILTDYLSSHRNSISQFIESLSNGSSEPTGKPKNHNEKKVEYNNTWDSDTIASTTVEQTLQNQIFDNPNNQNAIKSTLEINLTYKENPAAPINRQSGLLSENLEKEHETLSRTDSYSTPSPVQQTTQISSYNVGILKPSVVKELAQSSNVFMSSMSAPTTPMLKRRNTIRSVSGQKLLFNKKAELNTPQTTKSCQASPSTTPLFSRKRNGCGSLSKIPIIVHQNSRDDSSLPGIARVKRSASEPSSPMPTPMLRRRNSKIPIPVSNSPSTDLANGINSTSSKLDEFISLISNKNDRTSPLKIVSEKSKKHISIKKPIWGSPINQTLSMSSSREQGTESLPSTPVTARRIKQMAEDPSHNNTAIFSPTLTRRIRKQSPDETSMIKNIQSTIINPLSSRSRRIVQSCSSVPSSPNLSSSKMFIGTSAPASYESATINYKCVSAVLEDIDKSGKILDIKPLTPNLPDQITTCSEINTHAVSDNELQHFDSPQLSTQTSTESSGTGSQWSSRRNTPEKTNEDVFKAVALLNFKTPELPTTILDILNTDTCYGRRHFKSYDDTPLFEDKYIMSVRRKTSTNVGLPRADSLEEFLTLESECMTGRK